MAIKIYLFRWWLCWVLALTTATASIASLGGAAGHWAANASVLVNGINSPTARTLAVAPLASGAGHLAGGTASGVFKGQAFSTAFNNSFKGLGKRMLIGTGIGVASTVGVSYANGINPITGKPIVAKSSTKFLQQFNSVESLVGNAGKLARGKGGARIGNVTGNADDIFRGLANHYGAKLQYTSKGVPFFQSGNTSVYMYRSTSTGLPTLNIDRAGQIFKIRVAPQ